MLRWSWFICSLLVVFLAGAGVSAEEARTTVPEEVVKAANLAGASLGVDPAFILAIFAVESRFRPYAVRDETAGRDYYFDDPVRACRFVEKLKRTGRLYAVGLGQVVPRHWREIVPSGWECLLLNPYYNAFATAYILRRIYRVEKTSLWRVAARYNAGSRVERGRGYAARVLRLFKRFKEVGDDGSGQGR